MNCLFIVGVWCRSWILMSRQMHNGCAERDVLLLEILQTVMVTFHGCWELTHWGWEAKDPVDPCPSRRSVTCRSSRTQTQWSIFGGTVVSGEQLEEATCPWRLSCGWLVGYCLDFSTLSTEPGHLRNFERCIRYCRLMITMTNHLVKQEKDHSMQLYKWNPISFFVCG